LVWSEEIEREAFLQAADLFRLDVDLIQRRSCRWPRRPPTPPRHRHTVELQPS
jgi:hypothetical protein